MKTAGKSILFKGCGNDHLLQDHMLIYSMFITVLRLLQLTEEVVIAKNYLCPPSSATHITIKHNPMWDKLRSQLLSTPQIHFPCPSSHIPSTNILSPHHLHFRHTSTTGLSLLCCKDNSRCKGKSLLTSIRIHNVSIDDGLRRVGLFYSRAIDIGEVEFGVCSDMAGVRRRAKLWEGLNLRSKDLDGN